MKYDILSLGPARMDIFVKLPDDEVTEICSVDRRRCMIELGFGEKIAVRGIDFAIGGNAGNNAAGLARLGFKPALIGAIGDGPTDKQVIEELKRENVETKFMEVKPGQNGLGVVINYQGERTILSYYSESQCCFPTDADLEATWIYLTSMGQGYEGFYQEAVDWAVRRGVKIAFNPGTRQIKAGVEHLDYAYKATEVVFVNREEAEQLLGHPTGTEIKTLLDGLRELGPKLAIITDGPAGTYAGDGQKYWFMPIVPAEVVERTGAGDAFGSGFMGALLSGKGTAEALQWGTVNSASVLEHIGPQAGLLTLEKMAERVKANESVAAREI